MTKKVLFGGLGVVALLGLALVVSAQNPGRPRDREGFGMGPGGPGGPGGMMSGHCTALCTEYQFSYKRVSTQPFLVNGSASPITTTTGGIIARSSNGSTYDQVTLSGGPWGGQSGPREFIFITNLDPAVMMSYIENVTKKTYEERAIKQRTDSGQKRLPGRAPARDRRMVRHPVGQTAALRRPRTTLTNYAISDSNVYLPNRRQNIHDSHDPTSRKRAWQRHHHE